MTTNDDDHADERNTVLSKLYELADVAAMVYDEDQRARKGKSKIVYEEDEEASDKKRFFDHVPRKIRSAPQGPQPNFENLNGASTSSSSSPCSLTFENYMAKYKKTEMMKKPPNPTYQSSPSSCLTERTIPKRRVMSQRRSSSGFKKPKVASFSRTATEMPWWLVQVMRDMNAQDPTLIFEKALFASDVNPTLSRFLMPFNSLIRNDFLTPAEWSIIEEEDIVNDMKLGVGAILVDPRSEKWGVILKRWEMMKGSGNRSWSYSLTCGWNDIVKANELKDGDNIVVWSFRCRGILCFALVHLPLTMRHSSCSSSLPL